MNSEDTFILALAYTESDNMSTVALGDHGRAAGRFQWHPDAYLSWIPSLLEFHMLGPNPTWDMCFELAVRKFFRRAPAGKPLVDIAMAYHLHGQHIYLGADDPLYRERFLVALTKVQDDQK